MRGYWVTTSREEYPDERLSRLPQVTTLYLSNPEWVGFYSDQTLS